MKRPHNEKPERNTVMCELFLKGVTMEQIGNEYGVTKQRVQQILSRYGLGRKNGGAYEQRIRKSERFLAETGLLQFGPKVGGNV